MPLKSDEWWACSRPEAPNVSGLTIFDSQCTSCMIALTAAEVIGGAIPIIERDQRTGSWKRAFPTLEAFKEAVAEE